MAEKIVNIRVIPRAARPRIQADTQRSDVLRVYISEPPVDGAANDAVIQALAKYFDAPKSCINIIRGQKSRDKIIELRVA